jgi:fructokinase
MTSEPIVFAAVEGGGTSFALLIAEFQPNSSSSESNIPQTPFRVLAHCSISSNTPSQTLAEAAEFFKLHRPTQGYAALGVASFGPVGLKSKDTQSYGKILPGSPKREWRSVDVLTPFLEACSKDSSLPLPHLIDTDVNAPAMAEFQVYHKEDCTLSSLAYVTVGTGVGVGLVIHSQPVHGMMHPEGGHVPIAPLFEQDDFQGYSWGKDKGPFGGRNTVEGISSSVALTERWTMTQTSESKDTLVHSAEQRNILKELPDEDSIFDHAANALASLCVTLILLNSIEKIVLGGGVMKRSILFDKIRSRTRILLNGYLDLPQVTTDEGLKNLIVPSIWSSLQESQGVTAGLVGALTLAQKAYEKTIRRVD